MALALVLAGAPQGDAVVNEAIIPNLGGLSNDNAAAMVDHQAAADLRAGVNLDAGPEAAPLGDAPGRKFQPPAIQPVGHAVAGDSVDAGVEQQNLQFTAGGGVPALIGLQKARGPGGIFFHGKILNSQKGRRLGAEAK